MAKLIEGTILFDTDERGFVRNSVLSVYRFLRENNVYCAEYDSIFDNPTLSRDEFYAHHANAGLWRLDYSFDEGQLEIFETSHSLENEEELTTKPDPLINWVFPEEPYNIFSYWIKKDTPHERLFSFLTCDQNHYKNIEKLTIELCRHFRKEGRKVKACLSIDTVARNNF